MICVFPTQAITTPSMAVSHIMLEAYKKFIVVSLIHHGKVTVLPKYTSQVVSRFIKVGFHTVYNNNNNNMTLVKRKHIHLTSRRSRRDKEKR